MQLELGIDRFVFAPGQTSSGVYSYNPIPDLLEEIELADRLGIHVFGIGEHHTGEFVDSAPPILLAAAAARTQRIRLTSAITILGIADPVRVFEDFATLDLVSRGRAEIIVGRGAYAEAFQLFGLSLAHYDELFAEKLDLLLRLRTGGSVEWHGRHRAAITGQQVYPRPLQEKLPVWIAATGTPESFARAGTLGLPLALGIIHGEYAAYQPLVALYREAGLRAGHAPEDLTVAVHAVGYVADTDDQARDEFYPHYETIFGELARKVGAPEVTWHLFEKLAGPTAALVVGSPDTVARKMAYVSELLGGVSRFSLQMSVGSIPRAQRLRTIDLLATEVSSQLNALIASLSARGF